MTVYTPSHFFEESFIKPDSWWTVHDNWKKFCDWLLVFKKKKHAIGLGKSLVCGSLLSGMSSYLLSGYVLVIGMTLEH
uniref:Uncharacterized protein n=1 Tax=Pyxicephalus adspersus TaxID=30357 RepID=A0AAV2ZWN0_PYXAD|nr:TPA: hypothetical protein GDO54_017890 [Pyxicephalus adspersus]